MPAKPMTPFGLRPSGRRLLLGAVLLMGALAAGHALLRHWMSDQLQEGFAAWSETRRAQGWRVGHGRPVRGGWPFAVTLALPQFHLAGGEAEVPGGMAGGMAGGMEWQAEALLLRVSLPRVDRLVVEMPGQHRLRLGGASIPFAADRLQAELPLARHLPPRGGVLAGERLRFDSPAGTVAAERVRVAAETRAIEGEPAATLRGGAEGILLPDLPMLAALGRTLQAAAFDLALNGPLPPEGDAAGRAGAWREAGGTLALRALDLRWGPVAATIAATLTLDAALQPMGAGTLRLAGAAQALEAAAAAGLLTPGAAGSARTVVRLLSRPAADGGPPEVNLPLTLENRSLALARVPLVRLEPWRWPSR